MISMFFPFARQRVLSAGLLVVSAVFAGLVTAPTHAHTDASATRDCQPLTIKTEKLTLNPNQPELTDTGSLKFIAGWTLSSSVKTFGGLSDMLIEQDSLMALSDEGYYIKAHFDGKNQNMPFEQACMGPLASRAQDGIKDDTDAESLWRWQGRLLIGFEQRHRIEITEKNIESPSTPLPLGDSLKKMPKNGGIEAMTEDKEGRLLLFSEHAAPRASTFKGMEGLARKNLHPLAFFRVSPHIAETPTHTQISTASKTKRHQEAPPSAQAQRQTEKPSAAPDSPQSGQDIFTVEDGALALANNFSPTAARLLPNGDILLLARAFSLSEGVRAKIYQLHQDQHIDQVWQMRELAHLASPLTVDNFEALALMDGAPTGFQRFALLSDDNYSPLQRSLFLIFDMPLD